MTNTDICFQLAINVYRGKWGEPLEVLDNERYVSIEEGFDKIEFLYGKKGSTLFIFFQGTRGWFDIYRDAQILKKASIEQGKVQVHYGFWKQYAKSKNQIESIIHDEKPEKVVFSGHSLGAAIATLHHFNTAFEDTEGIFIASPRVGNRAFAVEYKKRHPQSIIYRNGNDIVTTVPLEIMGFEHVADIIHLDSKSFIWGIFFDHRPHLYKKGYDKYLADKKVDMFV